MNELQPMLWSAAEVLRDHLDPSQVRTLTLRLLALRALTSTWPTHLSLANIEQMQADVVRRHPHLEPAFTALPDVDPTRLRQLGETLALADLANPDQLAAVGETPSQRLGVAPKAALSGARNARSGKMKRQGEGNPALKRSGAGLSRTQLGHAYEFLLGRFAKQEGRRAGQFYTPASLVRLMVRLIVPDRGVLYDPCCGAGGMFVHAAQRSRHLTFVGQECNPQTWALAALNLAVHGLRADLGPHSADTLTNDQHPDLRADFILANPPFNLSRWGAERLSADPRFRFGLPPDGNANLAWLQHIVARLRPAGRAAIVLANGSLTNNRRGEDHIRHQLVQSGLVEAIISLPEQLFLNTPIAACVWVLGSRRTHDDRLLLLDARHQSQRVGRVRRAFDDADVDSIATKVHEFRRTGRCDDDHGTVLALNELSCGQPLTPGLYLKATQEQAPDTALDTIVSDLRAQSQIAQRLDEQLLACLDRLT